VWILLPFLRIELMAFISQYQQDTQAQVTQLIAGSQLIDTPYGLVEFGQAGAGSAVILSHGSLGGYDQGLWLAGLLGPGFHYLAPSRFGYLRTPIPSDPSFEAQAGQYAALLDALQVERAAVIGLSAGGPAAVQFALGYPDRCMGLVMLSAISHRLTEIPLILKALYFGLLKINYLPWLLLRLKPAAVYQTNGVSPALLQQVSQNPKKMKLLRELAATSMLPNMRRAGMMNDWLQATQIPPYPLSRINIPTLVVHALNDPVVAFEFGRFSATQIPGASLLEVEDGGHFCCVTHSEKVVSAITHFLQNCFSFRAE
jgi:pimeloyl-ACP methyl ester carboxylesterase